MLRLNITKYSSEFYKSFYILIQDYLFIENDIIRLETQNWFLKTQ